MTLVAVAPAKLYRGVDAPGYKSLTYDWREPAKSPGNLHRIVAAYEVSDLGNALERTYDTDAHLVLYTVRERGAPMLRQPRVNKGGLEWIREQGFELFFDVFIADVDNPAKATWTPWTRAAAERDIVRLGPVGYYFSQHGYRVLQPLSRSLTPETYEPALRKWLAGLERGGIKPDYQCVDWTRAFRLPHVRRDGIPYRSPRISLERMRPVDPPTVAAAAPHVARALKPRLASAVTSFDSEISPVWRRAVDVLAVAIRSGGYQGERHRVFLALAGALLARRAPPEQVPAIIRAIASESGADQQHHESSARGTVARWAGGFGVSGYRDLPAALADALDSVTDTGRAHLREQTAVEVVYMPAAEAARCTTEVIRCAADGVTMVRTPCGLGKSTSARAVAIERAQRPGKLHTKTAVCVPTHELGKEGLLEVRANGIKGLRMYGPTSVLGPDDKPVCRFYEAAVALAAGGQSVPWELCQGRGKDPCEYLDTCTAANGQDGPDDARIGYFPHAMMSQAVAWVGSTGQLVIDELPSMLETRIFTVSQLEHAESMLARFEWRYATALAPSLRSAIEWTRSAGKLDDPGLLVRVNERPMDPGLLEQAFMATGATTVDGAVASAFSPDHRGSKAPPIRHEYIYQAKRVPGSAAKTGAASHVLDTLRRALTTRSVGCVELAKGERLLAVSLVNTQLADALNREGSTVVLDANADLHREIIAKCIGYEPRYHAFEVADGAPIARTMIELTATRKRWLREKHLHEVDAIARAFKLAVDWILADESTVNVGFVTMAPVDLALRGAQYEDVSELWAKWAKENGPELPEVLEKLTRLFRMQTLRLRSRLNIRHYGDIRGLDVWKNHDAIVTFGDPWQPPERVRKEATYLDLPELGEARIEALCRADLEQAQGRLRTIHRTKPGRQLHVGRVLPGGWREPIEIIKTLGGRIANPSLDEPVDLRRLVDGVGGPTAASRKARISLSAIKQYLRGERPPPEAVIASLRSGLAGERELPPRGQSTPVIDPVTGLDCPQRFASSH